MFVFAFFSGCFVNDPQSFIMSFRQWCLDNVCTLKSMLLAWLNAGTLCSSNLLSVRPTMSSNTMQFFWLSPLSMHIVSWPVFVWHNSPYLQHSIVRLIVLWSSTRAYPRTRANSKSRNHRWGSRVHQPWFSYNSKMFDNKWNNYSNLETK